MKGSRRTPREGEAGFQFGENVDGIAGEAGGENHAGRRSLHAIFQGGFGKTRLAVLDPGAAVIPRMRSSTFRCWQWADMG